MAFSTIFPLVTGDTVKYTGDTLELVDRVGTVTSTFKPFIANGKLQCMVNVQWADGSYDYLSSLVLEKVE